MIIQHSTAALADMIRRKLAEKLAAKRFTHVMGVEGLAVALAHQWGVDPEKVLLAALLHDYMKSEKEAKLERLLDRCEDLLPSDEDRKHPAVWHGVVAATIAKTEFGITDREVREAIFYHTTGAKGYNSIGMCLYVADTLEPTRTFPGVGEMRRIILPLPMHQAAYKTSKIKLDLLMHKHRMVHSQTKEMKLWLENHPIIDTSEGG
jgi:predicted HD superfamily hydrolase involved in NAD metabolism